MALTSKPKARLLVRRVQSLALVGGLALVGCGEAHEPDDGGIDAGGSDAFMTDGFVPSDGSIPNDGGFPNDLGTDDVGIPPMPPPVDAGGLDSGLIIGDGGLVRDGGSTFDAGLPPMPPPGDGGIGPRIDVGP